MTKLLPIFPIFQQSYFYIKQHLLSLSTFFLLSFMGIYLLGGFNLMDNPVGGLIYIIYTYLFYFCFVRVYFKRRPMFKKVEFINALVRAVTISLLAFAFLLLLKMLLLFGLWLLTPLDIFPHIQATWADFIASKTFRYALYGAMFLLLTILFYIPALAWVSAVIGRNASITLTFFHVKDNYWRIFFICFIIYGLVPFAIFLLSANSWFLRAVFSALFTVIQCVIYLNIYEFFYKTPKRK